MMVALLVGGEAAAGDWKRLPSLPDKEGFAGAFSGVGGGALIVAGGANFPDEKPWEGGTKVWYDGVFVLERPDGAWRKAGKLPRPLGYGVSVTHRGGVVCVGGGDANRNYADAFRLEWTKGRLLTTRLPALPKPPRQRLRGAGRRRAVHRGRTGETRFQGDLANRLDDRPGLPDAAMARDHPLPRRRAHARGRGELRRGVLAGGGRRTRRRRRREDRTPVLEGRLSPRPPRPAGSGSPTFPPPWPPRRRRRRRTQRASSSWGATTAPRSGPLPARIAASARESSTTIRRRISGPRPARRPPLG